jgi:glycolate oxidase FAD binding subunit
MSRFRRCIYTQGRVKAAPEQIANRIQNLLGDASITYDAELAERINGQRNPVVVVMPQTQEQVSAILCVANEERWTVAPIGGGTHLGAGNVPRPIDVVIRTEMMNRIVDYSPSDMVVCAEAGVPLPILSGILEKERQMLPIDPICASRASIGGIVSVSASGPMRASYGTLRDMTIGLKTIYPDGHLVRTGGKVVKNVAGYDMTKLFVGSYGTLAFLSEMTFKLRPLPLYRALVIVSGMHSDCLAFVQSIIHSQLVPSRTEALYGSFGIDAFGHEKTWCVAVDCDENQIAGQFQANALGKLADRFHLSSITIEGPEEVGAFWRRYQQKLELSQLVIRFAGRPKTLMDVSEKFRAFSAELGIDTCFSVSVTCGIGRVFVQGAKIDANERFVRMCRDLVEAEGGTAVIENGSVMLRQSVDSFGQVKNGFHLMKGIKKAIDPNQIMNPGRLLGGI